MFYSIGLPVIKSHFLEETLDSVITQSFQDYEVIIQNNSSSNEERIKIRSIVEKYLKDKRFRYYENDSQLLIYENFNDILFKAKADYFIILSDDDKLTPLSLEEFNNLILANPEIYLFHCRVKLINENNELISFSPLCNAFESLPDFMYHRLKGLRLQFLSDFIVSREKLCEIGGFPPFSTGWGLDDLTWFRLGENGVGYTSVVGLEYRVNPINLSNSNNKHEKRRDEILLLYKEIKAIVQSDAFLKQSIYPVSHIEKVISNAEKNAIANLFEQISSKNSLLYLLNFYIKNQKRSGFTYKALLRGLWKKYAK